MPRALGRRLLPALLLLAPAGSQEAALPHVEAGRNLSVGILLLPGAFLVEVGASFDVFARAGGLPPFLVADSEAPVATSSGVRLQPHFSFRTAPPIDVLVVPGGCGSHAEFLVQRWGGMTDNEGIVVGEVVGGARVTYYGNDTAALRWISATAKAAKLVVAHGWGALTLGDAGVPLAAAAAAPGAEAALAAHLGPSAEILEDRRLAISGKALTSQGGVAAYEACLHVVRHLRGPGKPATAIQAELAYSSDNILHAALERRTAKPSPPKTSASARAEQVSVGVLLLDGMFLSDVVGSLEPLASGPLVGDLPGTATMLVSTDLSPKATSGGLLLYPHASFADVRSSSGSTELDVLVVPGGIGSHGSVLDASGRGVRDACGVLGWDGRSGPCRQRSDEAGSALAPGAGASVAPYSSMPGGVVDFVAQAASSAALVIAHSWGTFLLADAGLLRQKSVTTSEGAGMELAQKNPEIWHVDTGQRLMKDGAVISSKGGLAAFEASVYVMGLLWGDEAATDIAVDLAFAVDNLQATREVFETDSGAGSRDSNAQVNAARRGRGIGALALALLAAPTARPS